MSRTALIGLIIVLFLLLCCCFTLVAGSAVYFFASQMANQPQPTATAARTRIPSPTPVPTATRQRPTPGPTPTPRPPAPTPPPGQDTETLLQAVVAPDADPYDLAARLKPELGEVARVVNAKTPDYKVGDTLTFWASNTATDENFEVEAELIVKSEHLYMWVEKGERVDRRALQRSAKLFDERIYPTNREFFGSEWTPGVDNDPRLHILHAEGLGEGVAGYYSSADEISSKINPYSNEKEMFYINLSNNQPGTSFYDTTLAHEFQHMIHWFRDANESGWINEGLSELAVQLNGMGREGDAMRPDQVFAAEPDLQLNTWPDNDISFPHYGNSYLFMTYYLSRFGEEATKALVANPANGLESFDATLAELNAGVTADTLFADWVVANWLDDADAGGGRWNYPDFDPDPMAASEEVRRLPAEGEGEVTQYGADYIQLPGSETMTIAFTGNTQTRLAATDAYSGYWAWWGNRVDDSDTRLTLPIDLTGLDKATLRYRLWYDIEELWDYAYIEVSTDGGQTWKILETGRTTTENPQGNAYGPGYSGKSEQPEAAWVLEEVDLSAFAGQPIQIRFEYVTDAAVTMPGMFIDDVEIPEAGYFNDFENGPGDWVSEGWLLTNNILNQRWLVQAITTTSAGEIAVVVMEVGPDGRGQLRLEGLDPDEDVILAISGLTRGTEEVGEYKFSVSDE
jgi:hypothetical protein